MSWLKFNSEKLKKIPPPPIGKQTPRWKFQTHNFVKMALIITLSTPVKNYFACIIKKQKLDNWCCFNNLTFDNYVVLFWWDINLEFWLIGISGVLHTEVVTVMLYLLPLFTFVSKIPKFKETFVIANKVY